MNKMRRIFVLTALVAVLLTVAMLAGCTQDTGVSHVHEIEKVSAKAATCLKDGNREYYLCVVCDETFADEGGVMPLSEEKYVIPAKGHNIAVHSEKESTCTTVGVKAYYECRNCHTLFHDADGMFMIMEAQTLPTLTHSIVKVEAKPAVGLTAGWLEHFTCIHCGALYKDANGLVATSMADIKLAPTLTDFEYKIAFTFGAIIDSNPYITTKYVDGANGLPATEFTIAAGATEGTQAYAWIHSQVSGAISNGNNLRIPTFSGKARELEMTFTNNGAESISFRYFAENNGDKGGIELTLAAGETKTVKFTVNPGSSIGCNYALKLLSGTTSEVKLVANGFFYCDGEIDDVTVYKNAAKTTFKVGDKFTTDGLALKAHGDKYDEVVIVNYLCDIEEGYVFTSDDIGTKTVTVAFGEYTVTYDIVVSK